MCGKIPPTCILTPFKSQKEIDLTYQEMLHSVTYEPQAHIDFKFHSFW